MSFSSFTAQQAANVLTPASVLAQIAAERPDLRPYLAVNPAAYPELLDWLAQLGDPAVDAALAYRAAQAQPAVVGNAMPTSVPPGVRAWETAATTPELATAPKVSGQITKPAVGTGVVRAGGSVGLALGGVSLALVVALVVGFFLWPRESGPAPSLRPYPTKPGKAWTFDPLDLAWSGQARNGRSQRLNVSSNVFEAGPVWVVGSGYSDEYRLAGLDPQTGAVRWQTELEGWPWCRGPGAGGTVVCLVEPGPRVGDAVAQDLVVLDAESGAILSRAAPGLIAESFEVIDQDVVVAGCEQDGTRRIARYASDGTTRWTVDVTPPGAGVWRLAYSSPEIHVLDEALLITSWLSNPTLGIRNEAWLIDHQGEVLWSDLAGTLRGVDAAGRLYLNTSRDTEPSGALALTQRGEVLWELPGYQVPGWQVDDKVIGRLVAFNSRGALVELDPREGSEKRVLLEPGDGRSAQSMGFVQVGKVLVAKCPNEVVAIDLTSGNEIWSHHLEKHVDRMWTDGDQIIVKSFGQLSAYALQDGSQVWRYALQGDVEPFVVSGKLALRDNNMGSSIDKGLLTVLES